MFPSNLDMSIQSADAVSAEIKKALAGKPTTHKELRSMMALAACSLTCEHLKSIILLVNSNLPGSALALLRPIFEARDRAAWLSYCASPQAAEDIWRGGSFPDRKSIHADLDRAETRNIGTGGFPMEHWYWDHLNGLTHSGVEQLRDRLTAENHIRASYPEPKLIVMLYDAAKCAVFAAVIAIGQLGSNYDDLRPVFRVFYSGFEDKPCPV